MYSTENLTKRTVEATFMAVNKSDTLFSGQLVDVYGFMAHKKYSNV